MLFYLDLNKPNAGHVLNWLNKRQTNSVSVARLSFTFTNQNQCVEEFIVSKAPQNIVSACQNYEHISHKSNMIFVSLIKGFLFVFSEEVGDAFFSPQLFQFFHNLSF